jgi:hypothetical protein
VVALSTCEAEYIVVATTICQGVFLGQLLCELKEQELAEPTLMVENKLAIAMSPWPKTQSSMVIAHPHALSLYL